MIAIKEVFTENMTKDVNVLVFAFVGDSVYTTFVRSKFAFSGYKTGKLNSICNKYVCAKGQSSAIDIVMDILNEDEKRICNTARNSHTKNIAKHSSIDDYHKATSFEALLGYLYLTDKKERLDYILNFVYDKLGELL